MNNESGNAIVKSKDVNIAGVGQKLALTRWYNSKASETATSLGTSGWSLSAGPDVYLEKLSGYRYDYHSPDGRTYGAYVRQSSDSSASGYNQFFEPTYGGVNAFLAQNPSTGNMTLTFHSSQQQYVFTAIGSSGNLYLSKMYDRSGNEIDFAYGTGTQLTSMTDPGSGRSVSFTHNAVGDITKITDSNVSGSTRTWQYGYDANRNLTSYTDPTGAVTSYGYAQDGSVDGTAYELTTITDPAQTTGSNAGKHPTTRLGYSSGQTVTAKYVTGTSGSTELAYLTIWAYSSGADGECKFNNGQPNNQQTNDRTTSVKDSNNNDTTYCFADRKAGMNQAVDVIDGAGHHRGDTFSPNQQPTTVTSPEDDGVQNGSTTASYGSGGSGGPNDQLQSVTEPQDNATSNSGATQTMKYKAASSIPGNNYLPTSKVNSSGYCTAYIYTPKGHVADTYVALDPGTDLDCSGDTNSKHWHDAYNGNGTISAAYDPNGSATAAEETVYTYNSSGDLSTVKKPGGSCTGTVTLCTTYTYDGDGRTATKTDGRGEKTTYSYDKDDRIIQVLFHGATSCVLSSGNCVQYGYDGEGNLVSRADKSGTDSFTYDLLNQQTQQSLADGTIVATAYDGEANLKTYTQTVPNVGTSGTTTDTVTYTYNAADQVTKVHDATGDINVTENKGGKPTKVAFPTTADAFSVNYDYFNSGKTKSIKVTDPGNANLPSYTYKYSIGPVETDQLQSVTTSTSAGSIGLDGTATYSYSPAGRLGSVSDSSSAGTAFSYNYDDAGQVTAATQGSSNTTNYGYDKNGDLCWKGSTNGTNLVSTCPVTGPSGDTTVTHDAAGENTGSGSATNTYDADQRGISLYGGATQSYLDQGNDLRAATGSGSSAIGYTNGPLGVTARATSAGTTFYTRDPHGNLLDEHGAGGTNFYLTNYQHSVMALVSPSGDYLNGYYLYSPYGVTTTYAQSGGSAAANNPWQYAGGYRDTLEGDNYYHFGARYYIPTNTRWTQADPKTGNINDPSTLLTYGYAGDDPVNQGDADGRDFQGFVEGAALGVASLAGIGSGGTLAVAGAAEYSGAVAGGEGLVAIGLGALGVATGGALIALTGVAVAYTLASS